MLQYAAVQSQLLYNQKTIKIKKTYINADHGLACAWLPPVYKRS